MKLQFLDCGGTIRKHYATKKGTSQLSPSPISLIPNILSEIGYKRAYSLSDIMSKDSLDMTHKDRTQISSYVNKADADAIIITHGTDTMIETAQVIQENLDQFCTKIILLMGSSIPYLMKDTDALRNMKYTLEKLDEIWVNPLLKQPQKFSDSRVFISMNQNLFDVNRVEKSNDGVFRELT